MTRLGIAKIEYVPAADCAGWEYLGLSKDITLSDFVTGAMEELPFVQDSASWSEEWSVSEAGLSAKTTISLTIRQNRDDYRTILASLAAGWYVFRVTTVGGTRLVVGSRNVHPTVKVSHAVEGVTTNESVVDIECESLTGSLYDVG